MSVNNLHDSKSRVAICSLVGYVTIRYHICINKRNDEQGPVKRGFQYSYKRNYFKSRNRFLVFWLDILLTL